MNYVLLRGNATKNHPLLRGLDAATIRYITGAELPNFITELSIMDSLIVCNDTETTLQRGRPKAAPNGSTALDCRIDDIKTLLENKEKRGVIAQKMGVSRVTLNDFIAAKLPQFHKAKN